MLILAPATAFAAYLAPTTARSVSCDDAGAALAAYTWPSSLASATWSAGANVPLMALQESTASGSN